jgi:hypothetical protein
VQDALIGQMARALGVGYSTLKLDLDDIEQYQRILARPPRRHDENVPAVDPLEALLASVPEEDAPSEWEEERENGFSSSPGMPATEKQAGGGAGEPSAADPSSIPDSPTPLSSSGDPALHGQEHAVPPSSNTERLQTIQQMVTEHAGAAVPGEDDTPRAFPMRADGLFPVTDVWHIEPGIDAPEPLRLHIAQFAREIAEEALWGDCVEPVSTGTGFVCTLPSPDDALSGFGRGALSLLHALSRDGGDDAPEFLHLDETLGPLLRGRLVRGTGEYHDPDFPRLSDAGLIKLFRLLRLARRLLDLMSGADASGH